MLRDSNFISLVLRFIDEKAEEQLRFIIETQRALACLMVKDSAANREVVVSRHVEIDARHNLPGTAHHVGREGADKANAALEHAHKIVGIEGLTGVVPDS